MTTSHQPQKARPSSEPDANVQREELPTAQSLSSHQGILQLQRTIGNRATIQRLKKDALERLPDEETQDDVVRATPSMEVQRVIQRTPLMGGDAMLAVSPYTTNWRGKKKESLYNTLVDALKEYEVFVGSKGKSIETLNKHLDAVESAAKSWVDKHGASSDAKATAIKTTLASATAIKAAITTALNDLQTDAALIGNMYGKPALWAKVVAWAETVWHLEENVHFYASFKTFTTVQQGKDIIAKHLLDAPRAGKPASPELFNVSAVLFNKAGTLFAKPDAQVTVPELKALFEECVTGGRALFDDLSKKARLDVPQGGGDSFVFNYISSIVPDIMGLG